MLNAFPFLGPNNHHTPHHHHRSSIILFEKTVTTMLIKWWCSVINITTVCLYYLYEPAYIYNRYKPIYLYGNTWDLQCHFTTRRLQCTDRIVIISLASHRNTNHLLGRHIAQISSVILKMFGKYMFSEVHELCIIEIYIFVPVCML